MKKLYIFSFISCVALVASMASLASDGEKKIDAKKEKITVHAAGRGQPWLNLQDGRELPTEYVGAAGLDQVMTQGVAVPTALASADFDEDGVPDLVSGYAAPGGGLIIWRRGNLYSIYPNQPGWEAVGREPFLSPARVFALPQAPDFLAAGDFDADGHWDVVAAARGSDTLLWRPGNGQGDFGAPRVVKLPGLVTALTAGEINRRDGLTDVVVGIVGPEGPQALVFEGPEGALQGKPEAFPLPAEATALALGQLDEGYEMDLAVATGSELLIIHGRDRRLSLDSIRRAEGYPAAIEQLSFPFRITSLAVGDFLREEGYQLELALLADDGTVHLLRKAKGRGQKAKGKRSEANGEEWEHIKQVSMPDLPAPMSGRLIRARVSSSLTEDLVVLDQANHQLHIFNSWFVDRESGIGGRITNPESRITDLASFDVESTPVAVLPMRLNSDALNDMVILQKGWSAPAVALTAPMATFTVNSTGFEGDAELNDGVCSDCVKVPGTGICQQDANGNIVLNGICSLRAAIQQANATPGADLITFNIGGGGAQTIVLTGELSGISDAVTIDGTTQPGFSGSPIIEVNHNFIDTHLEIDVAPSSVIRGLVLNRYSAAGGGTRGTAIVIDGSTNNIIEGNYLGTDVSGTSTFRSTSNQRFGVFISGFRGPATNNIVGGTTAAARNLISGHNVAGVTIGSGPNNLVQGNFIGTDVTGTMGLGNLDNVTGGLNSTIGGTTAGTGNVISGADRNGIGMGFGSSGNLVQGNLISTDVSGTADLGNGNDGVFLDQSGSNTIGGTTPAARNIISGNDRRGVTVTRSGMNLVQGNFIGTDIACTMPLGNAEDGIVISTGGGDHTIGGTASGAGNVISANGRHGILMIDRGVVRNQVQGNFIGTDDTGTMDLGNTGDGVFIDGSNSNTIGGTDPGAGNVISANGGRGVFITGGVFAFGNVLQGNLIGTQADGRSPLGNGSHGVLLDDVPNTTIGGTASGAGNIIAFNGSSGVAVSGFHAGNAIQSNSIFSNAGLGIDLGGGGSVTANDPGDFDFGPNNLQNFPVITSATAGSTTISGTFNSTANTTFTLEFFSNSACDLSGFGEGETFLGSTMVTTDSGGNASFTITFPTTVPLGHFITATATDPNGNTSEFSQCIEVTEQDTDVDGVSDDVENGAPNGGDGNSDGIPDSQQGNVTSLPNAGDGQFVTLESPDGTQLADVQAVGTPPNPPAGVDFPIGFFGFTVQGLAPGGATMVTLLLPPGVVVNTYFKFGPTLGNPIPDFFAFPFNGTTGAEILADRVILHFVDGQRGDVDLMADGKITDPGGPGFSVNQPPVAQCQDVTVSAGADCTAAVSIDNGSFDPDDDPITLNQDPPGPYPLGMTMVTLRVTDDKGASDQCTATVTVADTTPPTVTCPAGTTATADATCQAPIPDVTGGVTANDNCDPNPMITQSPAAGTLVGLGMHTIMVTATDASGNSATCTTTVTVINNPPTADAGPDQSVMEGATVTLDGSGSSDPDAGQPLSFQWVQTGGPPVTLSDPTAAMPTFTAPEVPSGGCLTLTFELELSDPCGASSSDTVEVRVNDLVHMEDQVNGNRLRLHSCNGTYCWETADGEKLTGPVKITVRGRTLRFGSGPGDPHRLQGVIDLRRRQGNAQLIVFGPGGGTFTILDNNLDDSTGPTCPPSEAP